MTWTQVFKCWNITSPNWVLLCLQRRIRARKQSHSRWDDAVKRRRKEVFNIDDMTKHILHSPSATTPPHLWHIWYNDMALKRHASECVPYTWLTILKVMLKIYPAKLTDQHVCHHFIVFLGTALNSWAVIRFSVLAQDPQKTWCMYYTQHSICPMQTNINYCGCFTLKLNNFCSYNN